MGVDCGPTIVGDPVDRTALASLSGRLTGMDGSITQIALYVSAGAVLGGLIVWLVRRRRIDGDLRRLGDDWQQRYDQVSRQKDHLDVENASLKSTVEAERASLQKHKHAILSSRTEIESLREKVSSLSKDVFTLGAERDELSGKLTMIQRALIAAKQRVAELQTEFAKSREFYKGQLASSFELRKALERRVQEARLEHESLSNLLMSSKSEHESISKLLTTAQSRLANFESLEQKVIALEADNAQLKHDVALANREAEASKRDAAEMEALKEQNRELAHCLESMEESRKQYERDALRYRAQYDQAEREGETLRLKLGDIEKSLAELEEQHAEARRTVADQVTAPPAFGLDRPDGEIDDLTEIVGIGKVFESMLHKLGIYYFRQIASFGPAELARVNAELKEFKGRIEHDDWIGQAKELHFKKYGNNEPA